VAWSRFCPSNSVSLANCNSRLLHTQHHVLYHPGPAQQAKYITYTVDTRIYRIIPIIKIVHI
jgi:hypothetical protein